MDNAFETLRLRIEAKMRLMKDYMAQGNYRTYDAYTNATGYYAALQDTLFEINEIEKFYEEN